jgi:hypothetical protein
VASVNQGERVGGQGGEAEFGWATEKSNERKQGGGRAGGGSKAKHAGTLALTGIRC